MKKSKNNKNLDLNGIMSDMETLLKTLEEINSTKLEDLDIDKLTTKVNIFEEKYKDITPTKPKNNLDTKK